MTLEDKSCLNATIAPDPDAIANVKKHQMRGRKWWNCLALCMGLFFAMSNSAIADAQTWDRITDVRSAKPGMYEAAVLAEKRRKAKEIAEAKKRLPVFEKFFWNEYARYVQSHTTVRVWRDGRWQITTKFSNGHRMAPHNMSVRVSLLGHASGPAASTLHEVTCLHPSFGGSASERTHDSYGQFTQEQMKLISSATASAKFSNITQQMLDNYNPSNPKLSDIC